MARYYSDENGNLKKYTQTSAKKKKKDEDDSWFKSGAFGDGKGNLFTDALLAIGASAGDVTINALQGLAGLGEGVLDLGMYGASAAADALGADKLAKNVKNAAKYNASEKFFTGMKDFYEPASVFGDKSDGISQGLGQVGGMLLTGGLGNAAGLGMAGTSALTTGTTFLSGTGRGMSQAYEEGASDKNALKYGLISGAGEAASELLFAGLGKGVNALGYGKGLLSLDDALAKKASDLVGNRIAKNLIELGVKAGAEGTEEVVSGIVSAVGKKLSYMPDKDLTELIKDEKLLDQFIAGAVTSGIVQSGYVPGMKQGSFREATSQGRDMITGLSSNEQKVLDTEIQNRIAEEEKDGKKLTNKEKSAIAKQAEKDLKRGYVSIDTIESTLGGDSYSTYKGRIDSEEKLQKEIKQLENIPKSQFTVGQRERLNKAREELAKLQETDSSELKSKLSTEVDKMTADDIYLRESYNEKGRRSTAYEADISKYDEKQQGTIQKAIDSGILNNTNRTHEFVDMIAKISADKGVSFDFADSKKLKESGFAIDGKIPNGFVKGKNITLNFNSPKMLNKVVGHEITHVLEGTNMYSELQAAVKEYAKSKGEYQKRYDALASLYKDVEGAVIENELTADMVGDYLFTDEDFINNLSTEKPGIFKKIYEEIKYLVKVATAGSKEAKQLEKVKRAFEKAYKQNMNNDHKIKYALTEYTDEQIESILKGSDREILKTDEEIKEFASRALVNDERETFGYLGIVSSDIIERIKSEVSEISAENRENLFGKEAYSLRIRQSEIAHLKKEGMTVEEAIDYVSKIPQIVTEFDEVRYSVNYRAGKRIEGLTFTKVFPNGKMYSYLMVSNKKGTMTVKTTYMDKHDYMKKGKKNKPSLVANTDVLANTSETRSASASNINVSQNSEKSSGKAKYSLSGENAYNVDNKILELSKEMEASGVDSEVIRKNTGWYRGYDTKWRFEIDDSQMELLDNRDEQLNLDNLIKHDKLFAAYPKLKDIRVCFSEIDSSGRFDEKQNTIYLNNELKNNIDKLKRTLIHEIQHSIQSIEGFARGASTAYWNNRLENGYDSRISDVRKEETKLIQAYYETKYSDSDFVEDMNNLEKMLPNMPRGKIDWSTLEKIEDDPIEWQQYDAERDRLSEKYGEDKVFDFMDLQYKLSELKNKGMRTAEDLYYDTAGEIEARDVAHRLNFDSNERKKIQPRNKLENRDRDNVVFSRFSISNQSQDTQYKGAYNVHGKDLLLEAIDDIKNRATSQETTNTKPSQPVKVQNDYTPNPEVYETEVTDADKLIDAKIENLKVELESKLERKEETHNYYNQEIARKQSILDKKKNKATKVARDLADQIERLKRNRDNADAEADKQINALKERIDKMGTKEYRTAEQRKVKQASIRKWISELIGDTSTWKDKKNGLSYKLHTLKRNLRDVIGDTKKADEIYRALQGRYNHNEALLNKEANKIKQAYADMNINKYEDQYIQMLGEYKYNPDTTLTNEVVSKFYEKHKKKIDTGKVDKAIEMARTTYDGLFKRVNEVLKEHGIKEIPYREGYFPHFTKEPQGLLAKLLNWKKEDNNIPTDIAGLTEQFKPNKSWQAFSQHRYSDVTDYSFLTGLDAYVAGSLDWIHHINDIQRFRAFENEIRYRHSNARVQEQIKKLEEDESLDADEFQAQLDGILAEKNNPLNQLVQNIRTHTNLLAGKKNTMDRAIEEDFSRNVYSVVKNASSRINANMVGGSISSALTNFIPITQSWSQVSPMTSLRAMKDTIKAHMLDDGVIEKSDFLTNRLRTADKLSKTTWDKVSDKISGMMEAVDSFSSQTVWRSKYLENIESGMSETEAIQNADEFAEGVMAGRSRGNMPVIFESKNPITKIFTAFQLEVANQYDYMFKDMPADMKNKKKSKMAKAYASMFVGAYAYNALYSKLTGRDAAFDPIGIIQELIGDLFDDEEDKPSDIFFKALDAIGDETPYVGGVLFDGGRIPISSALPYGEGLIEAIKGTVTDVESGDYENLTKEWLNPMYYLAMPAGGGQLKKTNEGLAMFSDDKPVAGSYTTNGNLRFAVEDNALNRIQATLFGQWASENAQKYIEDGRQPLKQKQIDEFAELGMSMQDYWTYRDGLKDKKTVADKFDYIYDLNVTDEQKNIMINNLLNRKEEVDMSNYGDFGSYEEFDYYTKNPEKHMVSKVIAPFDKYNQYEKAINAIESDKDINGETINGSRKEKVIQYINNIDVDYGAKILLYKMEYPSDDTYNMDIVEYLNERDDISYSEMENILKLLEFTVDEYGTVRWD